MPKKSKYYAEMMSQSLDAAKQHALKQHEWCSQQPSEWRRGDITLMTGADPLGRGWVLVKNHPRDSKLWFCVLRDDWDSLIGSADVLSKSELGVSGVLRCRCATWIHEDDMSLLHRIDRDIEAAAACSRTISKMFTDFSQLLEPSEIDSDPDYIDYMSDLLRYQDELTEYLHNGGDE